MRGERNSKVPLAARGSKAHGGVRRVDSRKWKKIVAGGERISLFLQQEECEGEGDRHGSLLRGSREAGGMRGGVYLTHN